MVRQESSFRSSTQTHTCSTLPGRWVSESSPTVLKHEINCNVVVTKSSLVNVRVTEI